MGTKPPAQQPRRDAHSDDTAVICRTFACGEGLARTIIALFRFAAMAEGRLLYPLGNGDQTLLLLVGTARELAYGRSGAMMVLHQIAPGELFGALLVGDGGTQNPAQDATQDAGGEAGSGGFRVEAETTGRLGQIGQGDLVRLMESYSCVALAVSRQLAQRLARLRTRMAETVLLSATGRVCAEIARLAATPDRTIRPAPVVTDLAVLARTTRETASRTLSQLKRRGILASDDEGLRLVAPHRLDELIY